MQYGMVIDLKRCIGCHACATSCRVANNLQENMWWCRVHTEGGATMDSAAGTYPDNTMLFYPVNCQHCSNPPCVAVCPVGATVKDEETGIVTQNVDECIGCKLCIDACPYEGVRTFSEEDPEYELDFPVGDAFAPKHAGKVVEKCIFCFERVKQGEIPACTELCPGRARFFGDLDDPQSDVAKKLTSRAYTRLLEEKGTEPNLYFLT